MPNAFHALDARLQLISRAEHSVDIQYYFIGADDAGKQLLSALKAAAARGVRVRLLVDDLLIAPIEPELAGLDNLPNVQVRLFNPFCCARGGTISRLIASARDLDRLNYRMHNKLLVADGVLAVAGGRNVGNEYFARDSKNDFCRSRCTHGRTHR